MPSNHTSKRCTKCKEWKPMVAEYYPRMKRTRDGWSPECKVCHRERGKEYNSRPEIKERERIKRQTPEHKEMVRISRDNETYREKNRQRANNHYVTFGQTSEYKAKTKAYSQTPKGKFTRSMSGQRRRSREKQVICTLSSEEWEHLLFLTGDRCVYCGKHSSECGVLQQEHVIPIIQNGATTAHNIRPACGKCNRIKSGRTPAQAGMTFVINIELEQLTLL